MKVRNSAEFETDDMPASHSISQGQVFGYVRSNRFIKSGKRTLVYRLPSGKHLAVSKPLVLYLALLVAAFAAGYLNDGHRVSHQSGGRTLPTAVGPVIDYHKLITVSAVHGLADFSAMQFQEV